MSSTQNGFELHGLQHSSPSQINLWQNAPALWIAEKLYGYKGKMSASAMRGVCIENAVVDVLAKGRSEIDAVADHMKAFNRFTAIGASDKDRAEGAIIAPAVSLALAELKPYGEPSFPDHGGQNKIEVMCNGDGWRMPIQGYLDLVFEKSGVIVDLKTTQRILSEMPVNHQRQAAIYNKSGGNKSVKFLYVSAKKAVMADYEEQGRLQECKEILNRQERFLRLGDKDLLRQIVHYDPDSFYFVKSSAEILDLFR